MGGGVEQVLGNSDKITLGRQILCQLEREAGIKIQVKQIKSEKPLVKNDRVGDDDTLQRV